MNELLFKDPIWEMMNWFSKPMDLGCLKNKGLTQIRRPHNLITHTDKDGNITGYKLETVYTPFKKKDVSVSVLDNNLTVKCGTENKTRDEEMDHCGVSYQAYEFNLKLSDAIDTANIQAKAEDGMLEIELPLKTIKPAEPQEIKIEVQ